MRTIPLTQGQVALVDDADYDAVNAHKWYALRHRGLFYAARNIRKPEGNWTTQYLHQFLMPSVPEIDHRDGNGLNNQRYNLRPATRQQNRHGFRRPKRNTTSKFRGVSWNRQHRKWQAQIRVNGQPIHLGYFEAETDAARAWDTAARSYRGEFAHLNFP